MSSHNQNRSRRLEKGLGCQDVREVTNARRSRDRSRRREDSSFVGRRLTGSRSGVIAMLLESFCIATGAVIIFPVKESVALAGS